MKYSPRWVARALWISLFVGAVAAASLGQGSKQSSAYQPIEERDRDHPKARDQWFMRGRTAPDGESAALLRYRAYQQKLQLRRQPFSARLVMALPHLTITSGWNPLGPAPLASDATGSGGQDYRQVSGRATAVAVDPADPTGNTVYLGGAHGGVWKSVNAGPASVAAASVTWTPVLDYAGTLAVGAIAIQPGNTDATKSLILVGTGEPNSSADSYYGLGILRSADGGQTWSLISSASSGQSFAGMGFSKIAFNSTPGKANVVVAAAAAAETGITLGLETGNGAGRGLYYSLDSGLTWTYATVQDAGVTVDPGSVTSVVYNKAAGAFFAALRYHGIYSSADGFTWSRLANQPAGLTSSLCPTPHSAACPIYRAEMTVVPGRNEMYAWVVNLSGTTEMDQGIWLSTDGGTSWKQINDGGIASCGDGATNTNGCGVEQGSYDLEIAAVPNGSAATDLYPGAINLYKCTIASPSSASPSCTFLNLTHVYGCSPASALAHVHPDQHALDFMVTGNPAQSVMYFANDGGIYRALDGYTGLATGSCSGQNKFDSLNETLGSMTQFVSFSIHPTDANTLLGGTQDNGSPATSSATTNTSWSNVLGGDGGYNAISPAKGTDWFTANPDVPPNSLNINYCGSGISCRNSTFNPVVVSAQVGSDDGSFYFPYILDPQAPTRLIVGTCRVWRGGPATSAAGTYAALSNNFDTGSTSSCGGGEVNLVRSLAAGGPKDANGFSKVIYAGTEGLGGVTNPPGGRVFVTTNAGIALMTDVTKTINPGQYPVSGIAMDSTDATGRTGFVTVMGFHVSHVFKTTDAGQTWTDFTANIPDAPADAVVVDSQSGAVYVGTDVGVFASSTTSANWTEVGPASAAGASGFLPNAPVTALRIFNSGGKKLLRASTYGRGIWEYNLSQTPDYQIAISNATLTIFPTQTATFKGTVTALSGYASQVALSCTGGATPAACTPSPAAVTPVAAPGTAFSVSTSGTVGDYAFNVHGAGADASAIAHDSAVTLHVVDFTLGAPAPTAVSVAQGGTSAQATLVVSGAGSFSGTVSLSCSGLPVGANCNFSPSASVSALPATAQMTITTTTGTPTGASSVTISAMTPGAPAAKTQNLGLTVTAPGPDYSVAISNSPLSAVVNQAGTFNGTLIALNGYASAVNLSCGAGAPPACTVSPASVMPTIAGAPFTVNVQSAQAQTYSFSISGAGTDAARLAHATSVVFDSLFTVAVTPSTTTQSVRAGQSAAYSLTVTPVGSTTFPTTVSFSCSGLPAGASCSNPTINSGATGVQTLTLTITTLGPNTSTVIKPLAQRQKGAPLFLWVSVAGVLIGGFARRPARRKTAAMLFCMAMASTVVLTSCGGGGSGGGGNAISVSISPKTANPFPTQAQQFTATVGGTTNPLVTWQVNGVTGGNASAGTVDINGLYTAPATVPSPAAVTVAAVSQADVMKSGSATVTIKAPTPTGTYPVTLTATVGTVTQNSSVTLTVQ